MSAEGKILIVDDEPNIVEVARLYLEHSGYTPFILYNGRQAAETVRREAPSLVLLDIMLPDVSGFDVCREIRAMPEPFGRTPIIMLTAKGESIDKLRGFNLGTDDYIVKPFDPNELIARVKAVLRRAAAGIPASDSDVPKLKEAPRKRQIRFGSLFVDLDQYKVTVDSRRIELTPKEIELLHFLADHPGRVYSRDDLLAHVWNFDFSGGTRTVDAHVKNLRKKLGTQPDWNIQTLWGIGYSFAVNGHA